MLDVPPAAAPTAPARTARPAALAAGRRGLVAGRYRLHTPLGYGGMSVVWLAEDEVLGRRVAIKEGGAAGEAPGARVLAEARAAARVNHPGVIQVYDIVEEGGPWIVMEALPGRTLAEALRADGPLPVNRVAGIGFRLASALAATHRAGVVHCDVKPANVHLCGGERVVLTDFGIAAAVGGVAADEPGMLVGSPAYMAPERIRGRPASPAADAFSLGATLYAAVEGRPPFDNSSLTASLAAVVHDPPRPCNRAGRLRPVLDGLLVKDPAQRLTLDRARSVLHAIRLGSLG
jgi:serine/threonine protein kinase